MANLRKTKSLQIIVDAFDASDIALSGVELVHRFRSDMNKTTVYRVLDRLEKQNFLHSYTDTNGIRWYARSKDCDDHDETNHHSHFQCVVCGKSKCIHVDIDLPTLPNHRVDLARLMLVGHCEDCLT